MARDGFGTYSVPNTFLPNTVMSATAVNQNFTDAGTELTNSLARDGQSAMSGQLKLWDGTATSTASAMPGLTFGLDTNTGFRRASADEMRWMSGGVDRFYIDSVGKAYQLGALEVVGTVTVGGPVVIATASVAALKLRRTENDTTARTIEQYQSGSGAGAKGDLQVVGGGSNDVATMRWRVNDIAVFEATQSLFTHSVDVAIGSNIDIDTDGFIDMAEITAPSSPGANVARVYVVDSSGTTRLAFKDSNGTITAIGQTVNRQQFDSNDTWTKPGTGTVALIQTWGGGGSGGRGGAGDGGGGGGGGGYIEKYIALASLSASVSVTIGAGGAAQTSDDTNGNAGGNTTFGAYLTAYGGGAGSGTTNDCGGGGGGGLSGAGAAGSSSTGGAGGTPRGAIGSSTTGANGNANPFGGGGGATGLATAGASSGGLGLYGGGGGGAGDASASASSGGDSVWGGGGGGGGDGAGTGASGGTAIVFGGNGGAGNTGASAATAGTAPAGGGGGSESGNSGAGAAGRCIVTVW